MQLPNLETLELRARDLAFSHAHAVARADAKDGGALLADPELMITDLLPLARYAATLEAMLEDRSREAKTDALTGLLRRGALDEAFGASLSVGARTQTPVGVILVDLDHFKRINDEHGHQIGDAVLRRVGAIIRELVRETDSAGRYGGEELMVVTVASQQPEVLADRIREAIEAEQSWGFPVTASFGVAVGIDGATDAAADAIKLADEALYQAKRAGRNRVVTRRIHEPAAE
jgi:diguanylate cyclase (GGDEF)-like protein